MQLSTILVIIITYNKRRYNMLDFINKTLGITVKLALLGVLLITGGVVDFLDFDLD